MTTAKSFCFFQNKINIGQSARCHSLRNYLARSIPGIDLFTVFSTFCMDQLGKTVDATEKRASKMSPLWGAVSSLDYFNKSLWNLAILLILRRFFQWRRRIFPNLSMSKVEKKPWKGLLAGKGLMRSPWGSSPVGGLIQRVDFSGFIVLQGTWAEVRWPSMADG